MVKFLMFRLSAYDNPEQGMLSAPTAQAAVEKLEGEGWNVFAVNTTNTNDAGTQMVITLKKANAPTAKA